MYVEGGAETVIDGFLEVVGVLLSAIIAAGKGMCQFY